MGEGFEATTCGRELTFDNAAFDAGEMTELGMTDENGGYTGLGLLFSDQCPYTVKVSVYGGEDRGGLAERRVFGGPLAGQIDGIMEFLNRDDNRRVKEMLAAALTQRDYAFPGELLVNVFSDRVEFIGMGALKDVDGFDRWRNEKLLAALRRLRHSAAKPKEFTATRGAFMVVLRNETPPGQKLLDHIAANGSINRKEAEAVLGLKQTAAGKVLKELLDRGLVEPVGGGKNTKYVLKSATEIST